MTRRKLLLVPLDDRPCNLRFPEQLGRVGGCSVVTPRQEWLGSLRTAGDSERILGWLSDGVDGKESAAQLAGMLLSTDMICYGGLVASRTPRVSTDTALARMRRVGEWKAHHPEVPLDAFNIITRLSITVDSDEAAKYYAALIQYAQLEDQASVEGNPLLADQALEWKEQIPAHVLEAYLQARSRNHQINRMSVGYVEEGVFGYLVLCQEDAAAYGFHRREQEALRECIRDGKVEDRVDIYPGADEAGCVLLARRLLQLNQRAPVIRVSYSDDAGTNRIPPFEDVPLNESIRRRIGSMGCRYTSVQGEEDLLLCVNVPDVLSRGEATLAHNHAARVDRLTTYVAEIARAVADGTPVAVADVAFPNGGDTALIDLLLREVPVVKLLSYGGWNTAGNTLGTVLAHSLIRWLTLEEGSTDAESNAAHFQFLFERFVDDWAYQAIVRREVESQCAAQGASIFNLGDAATEVEEMVRAGLAPYVDRVFNQHFRGTLGSASCDWTATLPWQRLFEVDFRATLR